MKILTIEESKMLNRLLFEIQDESLQAILRKTIFGTNRPVEETVKIERPHYTDEDITRLKS